MTRWKGAAWTALVIVPAFAALAYMASIHSPFFMSGLVTSIGAAMLTAGALWLLPPSIAIPPVEVRRPAREAAVMLAFLAVWSVAFLGWGMNQLSIWAPDVQDRFALRILVKLIAMVLLPSAALIAAGGEVRDQWRGRFDARGFWLPLLVLGTASVIVVVADPMAAAPSAVPLSQWWFIVPLTLIWLGTEAGLCEEYLFRACLQTRLSAWLRNDVAAVSLSALIFGLTHFPGFAWRQPPPGIPGGFNWVTLAYCMTAVAPLGAFYGVIWARTRNLWLCVAIHALCDIPLMVVIKTVWFS